MSGSRQRFLARAAWIWLTAAGVAACAAPPTATPRAVPRVYTSPYAVPIVRPWAEKYLAETGAPLPFDLDPRPRSAALDLAPTHPGSLLIFDGPPPSDWFVTPLDAVPVVILVHADNPLRDLAPSDLTNLFARRTARWGTLGGSDVEVQPILPLPGEPVRDWFEDAVMRGTPVWPGAWLAPTPEAMLTLVASDPGAVGFLLGTDVPADLTTIRVQGLSPTEVGYPFQLQLLAFAPQEPTGGVREWLGWVQARVTTR